MDWEWNGVEWSWSEVRVELKLIEGRVGVEWSDVEWELSGSGVGVEWE